MFGSREDYERYNNEVAPQLREEGKRLFGDKGVTYERRIGNISYSIENR